MNAGLLFALLLPLRAPAADDASARARRVENGLLPAVTIKGQAPPRFGIEERMRLYGVPGVSVAFIDGGKVAWTRAYGYADAAATTRVTPETLFQAASISKPVAAAAALRLVERGALALDEDVNAKLRSWKVPDNGFTKDQKVTLRRILSHSAGLGVHGFGGYAAGEPVPSLLEVLDGKKPANSDPIRVEAAPGSVTSYSGGGFTVMQLLMTEASGEPFPRLLRELVLIPAGMTQSSFEQPLPDARRARAAAPKGGTHTYPELAAAGLWTTPGDLARFAIAIQDSYLGKKGSLLSRTTAREMLTDQREGRGLGFGLTPGTPPRFSHNGLNFGFTCVLHAYAEDGGQGIVVMTNTEAPGALIDEIVRAAAAEYGWKDLLPAERTPGPYPAALAGLAGVYAADKNAPYAVTVKDGKVWLKAGEDAPLELLPGADGRFFVMTKTATFRFIGDGAAARLVVEGGKRVDAPRVAQ